MTLKKIVCLFVVFFILTMSCTPLVFALFDSPTNSVPTLSVPFTKPDLPYVMCVWLNNNTGKLLARMWTFDLFVSGAVDGSNERIDPSQIQYRCGFNFTSDDGNFHNVVAYAVFPTILTFPVTSSVQFYTATIGNDYYRIYDNSPSTFPGNLAYLSLLDYDNVSLDDYTLYGCFFGNGFVMENPDILENKIDVAFSDAVNQSTIKEAIDLLYSLDWQLHDVYYLVNIIDGRITLVNEKLDKIVEILEDMHNVTPSETTTNGAVSDFVAAEDELLGDSFGNLQSFEPEPFDLIEGSNSYNALMYIGNLLDFFTSNGKFRSAILVVLSLAIAGILINLYPLHKGD